MAPLPTSGQSGYFTPTVLRVRNGKWWENKHKSLPSPHVGKVATSPLPRGCPMLSGGGGQKKQMAIYPTYGQTGYITLAVLGVPTAQRGDKNQKWLPGPHVGQVATLPVLRVCNGKVGQETEMATWTTYGQRGYITLAASGVPNAQRGDEYQKWLPSPHVGKVTTSPLTSWGSPTLGAGTKKQKWLLGTHAGKVATSPLPSPGYPTLSGGKKGINGFLAHMWAKWLHHPYHVGGPQCSVRGQKLEMATCLTCGQSSYITPDVSGVSNPRRRNKKLEMAT